MPSGTEDQVGFLVPQSKQTFRNFEHGYLYPVPGEAHLVGGLGLQLFE